MSFPRRKSHVEPLETDGSTTVKALRRLKKKVMNEMGEDDELVYAVDLRLKARSEEVRIEFDGDLARFSSAKPRDESLLNEINAYITEKMLDEVDASDDFLVRFFGLRDDLSRELGVIDVETPAKLSRKASSSSKKLKKKRSSKSKSSESSASFSQNKVVVAVVSPFRKLWSDVSAQDDSLSVKTMIGLLFIVYAALIISAIHLILTISPPGNELAWSAGSLSVTDDIAAVSGPSDAR